MLYPLVSRTLAGLSVPRLIAPSAATACLLLSLGASAHIQMKSPLPRYADRNANKSCPCGAGGSNRSCNVERDGTDTFRSACVTTYEAGSTITVSFEEYIGHPGRYRVALDPVGSDFYDFNEHILLDVPDPNTYAAGRLGQGNVAEGSPTWELQVTLPDEPCEDCTLQLIQAMHGDTVNEVPDTADLSSYYVCADIRIVPKGAMPADGGQPSPDCYADPGTEFTEPTNEVPMVSSEPEPAVETAVEDAGAAPFPEADQTAPSDPIAPTAEAPPTSAEPSAPAAEPRPPMAMNGSPTAVAPAPAEGNPLSAADDPSVRSGSSRGCSVGRIRGQNQAVGGFVALLGALAIGRRRRRLQAR